MGSEMCIRDRFPNVLMLPWLLCDYNDSKRDMTMTKYRVIVFLISLLGLVVPIFNARPVFVMIVSQAFNAVILPVTVACIFYLCNRKDLMGENRNKLTSNLFLALIFVFSIFTSIIGVKGVWQTIMQ